MFTASMVATPSVVALLVSPFLLQRVEAECFTYLAPSTIPGAGFGMFAGDRSYKKGDVVTMDDVVIPIIDLDWHTDFEDIMFLWNEYVWSASMFPGMELDSESGSSQVSAASGGMGAAVNCHLSLHNVIDDSVEMDQTGLSPDSPGIGAFTPYHGRAFRATREIPAGMELFADYGYGYFEHRDHLYGAVPFEDNYHEADQLSRNFLELEKKIVEHVSNSSSSLTSIESVLSDLWSITSTLKDEIFSRTLAALPSSRTQIPAVLEAGGTALQDYNRSIRSLEWLEKNGQCMDNIKPGKSTVPHAGRGVFANRFLAEGSLVAPAPLIHIPDSSVFTIYGGRISQEEGGFLVRDTDNPTHSQLLLNYCFGHDDSTLLLCPYGLLTSLINHHRERANAKIVWTDEIRHPEWKEQKIEEWSSTFHTGLSFDFVATRDIQEDEEILIDYGDLWEEAWKRHIDEHFAKGPPREHFLPAAELNTRVDLPIRTMYERPYDLDDTRVTVNGQYLAWAGIPGYENEDFDCIVMHRNEDRDTYIVHLVKPMNDEEESIIDDWDGTGEIMLDFPRAGFFFYDVEECTRDHVQTWSFRHPMMIRDELFPEVWKNKL